MIADNPQRFVVDSMYGSGRGVIKSFLQGTGCEIAEIRGEMNPGFGGVHPEPIAKYLGALAGAIGAGMGNFGLATDGDADRIGAMDETRQLRGPAQDHGAGPALPGGEARLERRGGADGFHHAHDRPPVPSATA